MMTATLGNRSSCTDRRAESDPFRFGISANSVPDLLFIAVMPDIRIPSGMHPWQRQRQPSLAAVSPALFSLLRR